MLKQSLIQEKINDLNVVSNNKPSQTQANSTNAATSSSASAAAAVAAAAVATSSTQIIASSTTTTTTTTTTTSGGVGGGGGGTGAGGGRNSNVASTATVFRQHNSPIVLNNKHASNEFLLPHMPQWPRVHIGKHTTISLKRNSIVNNNNNNNNNNTIGQVKLNSVTNAHTSNDTKTSTALLINLTLSSPAIATNTTNTTTTTNNNNHNNKRTGIDYEPSIPFTMSIINDSYTNYSKNNINININSSAAATVAGAGGHESESLRANMSNGGGAGGSDDKADRYLNNNSNSNNNNGNSNGKANSNMPPNRGLSESSSSPPPPPPNPLNNGSDEEANEANDSLGENVMHGGVHRQAATATNSSLLSSSNDFKLNKQSDKADAGVKLRYLEKSIRFIQQQHADTLTSLHDEIEKLKVENRNLQFRLVRANSPQSQQQPTPTNVTPQQQQSKDKRNNHLTVNNNNNNNNNNANVVNSALLLNSARLSRSQLLGGDASTAAMDDSSAQLHRKRLAKDSLLLDSTKIEEIITRMRDAETKNEHLTSVIDELQRKQRGHSSTAYINNSKRDFVNADETKSANQLLEFNYNSSNNILNASSIDFDMSNLYSVRPLRVKMSDADEPRMASIGEAESIIRKLYDLYKEQKQQISNMKFVLNELMQTENLSYHSVLMARDILDNEKGQFAIHFADAQSNMQKKMLNTMNRYGQKYQSQIITSLNSVLNLSAGHKNLHHHRIGSNVERNQQSITPISNMSNMVVGPAAAVHLPPLQSNNAAKYPERQRRTRLLQRQRLNKDYFH